MTASANGDVVAGSGGWPTARAPPSPSRSPRAGGDGGSPALPRGRRLGGPVAQLRRLGLLRLASRLEAAAQLGNVPDLGVGPPDQAPDQGGDDAHGEQHTYKEEGEQEFEQRH